MVYKIAQKHIHYPRDASSLLIRSCPNGAVFTSTLMFRDCASVPATGKSTSAWLLLEVRFQHPATASELVVMLMKSRTRWPDRMDRQAETR